MPKLKLPSWITTHCEDCGRELPIEVFHSAAGYYIGQWCPVDGPYSRISQEYYKSYEIALEHFHNETFTIRQHP